MCRSVPGQDTAILSTKLTKKAKKWPHGLNLISNLEFLANFTLRTKVWERSDNRKKIDYFSRNGPYAYVLNSVKNKLWNSNKAKCIKLFFNLFRSSKLIDLINRKSSIFKNFETIKMVRVWPWKFPNFCFDFVVYYYGGIMFI